MALPEPHTNTKASGVEARRHEDEAPGARRVPRTALLDGFERFHWLHSRLGLAGNLAFFVGSVLFLWESAQVAGTWLFIIGSLGMLLGSLGDKVARLRGDA